jgi:hypothetical protein
MLELLFIIHFANEFSPINPILLDDRDASLSLSRGSLISEASEVQAQTQTSYKSRRTISKMASFMVRSAQNATLTCTVTCSKCYGSRVPIPERG